jgi:peptide/nickel transport system ATP-binding protein
MNPLLATTDLKAYFSVRAGLFNAASVRAVDGVSLEIRRGETLALVGESGSGKTTLGRAVLRLIEPTGGSILFDGEDVSGFRRRKLKSFRRKAQAIFQDPYSSISPYMSVRDIIAEPLLIHGFGSGEEREEKVLSVVNLVKLSPAREIADKYPHGLSGGQRQRVCIARAIILEPEFVVADEPVSMVDASNRAEILQLLRELQERKGIAFLYITHDIASARHFSDRMAVMYLGTVVETGPTHQVIDKAMHPYTRGLLAAVPEPDAENRKRLRPVVPGEPPSASAVPSGCPFHPRCPEFMKGRCEISRPELKEVPSGYRVACYLYE